MTDRMFIDPKPGDAYRRRKPWTSVVTGVDVSSGSSQWDRIKQRSSGVHITSVGSVTVIRSVGSRNEVLLYFQFRRLTSCSLPVTRETLSRRGRRMALICYTLAFRETFRTMWIGNGNGPIYDSGPPRKENSSWTNNTDICIRTSICTVFQALIESDYGGTVSSRLCVSFSRDVGQKRNAKLLTVVVLIVRGCQKALSHFLS